jgi:hypothetical protein
LCQCQNQFVKKKFKEHLQEAAVVEMEIVEEVSYPILDLAKVKKKYIKTLKRKKKKSK